MRAAVSVIGWFLGPSLLLGFAYYYGGKKLAFHIWKWGLLPIFLLSLGGVLAAVLYVAAFEIEDDVGPGLMAAMLVATLIGISGAITWMVARLLLRED